MASSQLSICQTQELGSSRKYVWGTGKYSWGSGQTLRQEPENSNGARASRLPPALSGDLKILESSFGKIAYYEAGLQHKTSPLLLIHSINAAGSAYEVKPLFEHYSQSRPVYALDLPGFGHSERSNRDYPFQLMTNAIRTMAAAIGETRSSVSIDALALSLSCEFLARAASESPNTFRSIALVSPTGFDRNAPYLGPPGSSRGSEKALKFLSNPFWAKRVYELLTIRSSIRFFLQKTWGSRSIDQGLLDYDCLTTRQPGAHHVAYWFLSFLLFSNDITRIYESLQMPVWMAHGVRGDFTDYSAKNFLQHSPNWVFDVFQSGALPHFEVLDAFTRSYDRFIDGLDQSLLRQSASGHSLSEA